MIKIIIVYEISVYIEFYNHKCYFWVDSSGSIALFRYHYYLARIGEVRRKDRNGGEEIFKAGIA